VALSVVGEKQVSSGVLVWQGKVPLAAKAQLVVVCVKIPVDFELDDVCIVKGK
jgi:hypothetical protein